MGKRLFLTKKEKHELSKLVVQAVTAIKADKKLHWKKRQKAINAIMVWYVNMITAIAFVEHLSAIAKNSDCS